MSLRWEHLGEDVVRAVAAACTAALPGMRVQCMETLSDGPQDTPLLQVHWFGESWDPHGGGETDRTTFFGALKQVDMQIQLWTFIRQRSLHGEDAALQVHWADRIRAVLLGEGSEYFGVSGAPRIRACGFRVEPVSWTVGGDRRFAGARYTLSLRIY